MEQIMSQEVAELRQKVKELEKTVSDLDWYIENYLLKTIQELIVKTNNLDNRRLSI